MDPVFISWGGGNTWPQTWWLKTTPVHSLRPAEPHPLKSPRTAPPTPACSWGHLPSHLACLRAALLCASAPPSFIRTLPMGFGPIMASSAQELGLNYLCKDSCSKWDHVHSFQDGDFGENHPSIHRRCWCLNICHEDRTWVLLPHSWLLQLEGYE